MPVPISQMYTVASHVIKQRVMRRKRYPLVLMLEPLFRCNLACAGCGKIQYPAHVLKRQLAPEECFKAVDECGAPIVSIPGGEPLMHPQIDEIVKGLVARKKYVYLCTNALLLKEKLDLFTPTKFLTFSVHMDGQRENHDFAVCREGGYDIAIEGIKEALARGFRVTTNTTLFDGADPKSCRAFFDEMMELGVEGMMLSPGYSYDRAPDQQHFLPREKTRQLFRKILSNRPKKWHFNQSPLFLEFLMGKRHYACTPWGMPTYNIFGWQKPCYLLQDGYADTFQELMQTTEWEKYGTESGNPKCANCMVHSGYEASAVAHTFNSIGGLLTTARAVLFNRHHDPEAEKMLEEDQTVPLHLVQIEIAALQRRLPRRIGTLNQMADSSLQGWIPPLATDQEIRHALEEAFSYRGDVTLTLKDEKKIDGYIFDRRSNGENLSDCLVRVMLKEGQKINVKYSDIARLEFTGRDPATGKSFETWINKYREKKLAGEKNIGITPETLE